MKTSVGLIFLLLRPIRGGGTESEQAAASASVELRFSYKLLEKLIQYLDTASINMKLLKPSSIFSRRNSFKTSTRDIKFFSKVLFVYFKIQYSGRMIINKVQLCELDN
jgi:ryanodine receptor 2